MVEAYKKYVLTSLLVYGKMEDLPSYASFAVRQIKSATQVYSELVTAHSTADAESFLKVVAQHHDKVSACARPLALDTPAHTIKHTPPLRPLPHTTTTS
jgi:hypothetical protein